VLVCSYQDSLNGELRADSDTVLAHGTGGTPHGSALSTASAGSYSPADGSSSPPGAACESMVWSHTSGTRDRHTKCAAHLVKAGSAAT
jgi:hypothetical protein